ncbi:MAG: phosphatidylserine decarboxylase family protein [Bacteroidota bacterium]
MISFKIHKEGLKIIIVSFFILLAGNLLITLVAPYNNTLQWVGLSISIVLFLLIVQFFRNPNREVQVADNNLVYAPADGKIVVIEEVKEVEYFGDNRIQVSIFMSPTNVHVNRNPISGKVNYFKYHPGKYLVAWHPKSSTENERTTVVIGDGEVEILLRQIAGALAKRIVNYLDEGQEVKQGKDFGFIKFGSRVDLFLPVTAKIKVDLNQKVKGNRTIIAEL